MELDRFWKEKLERGREEVSWAQVLQLLVENRLIDPGSEFRVHRQWFDQSAMDVLLRVDFAVAVKDRLYRCLDRILKHKRAAICRDDRDLNQHFLRPAAKSLGFYWKGFGWHSLRREAVTAIGSVLGIGQAMKMAGHSTSEMNILYTLSELRAQDEAVRARQEAILGKAGEKIQ